VVAVDLSRSSTRFIAEFQLLSVAHGILESAAAELGALGDICLPNCGVCCTQNVARVLECEAAYVVSVLLPQPGKLRKVIEIAAGWLQESKGFDMRPPSVMSNDERFGEYVKSVAAPCPFLCEDKQCLIHEARPVVCRAYGVTRTTGPECHRPLSMKRPVPYIGGVPEARIKDIMGKLSKGATTGLLPTLILLAADPKRVDRLIKQGVPAGKILLRDGDLPGVLTQDQWVAELGRRAEARRRVLLSYEPEERTRPIVAN
jgi:Fe-S-cluster containining protein